VSAARPRLRAPGLAVAVALAAALLDGRARAQGVPPAPAPPPPPAGARPPAPLREAPIPGDGRTPDQLRGEVMQRMRALRAWRIVEALKLDEATSARLFPIMSRYDDREMALASERWDIRRVLRAEVLSARPDDARLSAAINRLLANRERQRTLEDERVRELRKVLTPVQQAQLMLLLPRLEREFAQRVQQAVETQRRLGEDPEF
jgi:Spy/CpxP family protein refolding chaperone